MMIGIGVQNYPIHIAVPSKMHTMAADGYPPSLPFVIGIAFVLESKDFARIADIGADPTMSPCRRRADPPTGRWVRA